MSTTEADCQFHTEYEPTCAECRYVLQARHTPEDEPEDDVKQPPAVLIPVATLKRWKENIDPFWFEGDYNNDPIIETSEELGALIKLAEGGKQ